MTVDRTIPKLGWHFWFILVDLLSGFCWGGVATGQDCPGGQCPIVQYPRGWPATPVAVQTPMADYHRAIVRVGREDLAAPGASFSGAGTFVARGADRGLVLTASHVVDQGGGRIWVDFGRGRQTASLLGRDTNLDLAALVIDHPPVDVHPIPVAGEDEWPRAGENVEVVGFGGGRFRHYSARLRGYTTKDADRLSQCQAAVPAGEYTRFAAGDWPSVGDNNPTSSQARSQMAVAFQPISGDSGGAVLFAPASAGRQSGSTGAHPAEAGTIKLAGILWGGPCDGPQQAAYETHATCCIYIRRFLNGIGVQLKPRQPPAERSPGPAQPSPTPLSSVPPSTGEPLVVGPAEVVPPPTMPQPVPQNPPPTADSERLAAIEKRLADLAAQVSPAGTGPAGASGARGPQGLPGPAGKDADPAALAAVAGRVAALEKNLKGKLHFSLQVDSQTGKILSTSSGSP